MDLVDSDTAVTTDLEHFVRGLPKAELHVHIEGTLEPELLFDLAARNGIELAYPDVEALRAAYRFSDLQSFLDIYYQGADVLRTAADFEDLMTAYLDRAAADGVRRTEMFFDPQTHTERGIGFEVFMPGFLAAMAAAEERHGISSDLIMCFLRHLPGAAAVETFEAAADYHDAIIGVGLDSSERDHPPEEFAAAFELAAAKGMHRVAHAGEEGPPAYISGALDALGVERIDHGVRCEEDPELVERLLAAGTPLTVCPLSNLALGGVARMEDHNIRRLFDRGLKVTVNSDDPAYFGGYVVANYVAVAEALDMSRADLAVMARHGLEASFATDDQKQRWLSELGAYLAES